MLGIDAVLKLTSNVKQLLLIVDAGFLINAALDHWVMVLGQLEPEPYEV